MRHLDVTPAACLIHPTRAELRLCWARYRYLYRLACHEAFALVEPDLVREAVAEVRHYRGEMRAAAELRLAMRSESEMTNDE